MSSREVVCGLALWAHVQLCAQQVRRRSVASLDSAIPFAVIAVKFKAV